MKKLFSFLCCLSLCFSSVCICMAADHETPYQYLYEKGIPKAYLDSISDEQIDAMYDTLFGTDFELSEIVTTYLEEDTNNESVISPYGSISPQTLTFQLAALRNVVNNQITYVSIWLSWSWNNYAPQIRKKDGISINWNSSHLSYKAGSFQAAGMYTLSLNPDDTKSSFTCYEGQTHHGEQAGRGFDVQLMKNPSAANLATNLGFATFTLLPAINMSAGSSRATTINAQYLHDRNPLPATITFSTSVAGLTMSSSSPSLSDTASASANVFFS